MPRMSLINNATHWRCRAEEMRVAAEDMRDPETRATALRIAADYDRLAERAEERSKRSPESAVKRPVA